MAKAKKKKMTVESAASALSRGRWAKIKPKERSRLMKAARRAPGSGRQRSADRCYCGANSKTRAIMRAFDCCKRAGLFPSGRARP